MRNVAEPIVKGINAIPEIDGGTDRGFYLEGCNAKTERVGGVLFHICAVQDRVIVSSALINAIPFFDANNGIHSLYLFSFSFYVAPSL